MRCSWVVVAVFASQWHEGSSLAARRVAREPRSALGAIDGRVTFVATVAERSIYRSRPHAPRETAVCLSDVDVDGRRVTDHCWLTGADARALDGARFACGARVAFDAEVATYRRGRRRDWRLSRVAGARSPAAPDGRPAGSET